MNLPHFFSAMPFFVLKVVQNVKTKFLTASQPKCVASRKDSKSCVHTFRVSIKPKTPKSNKTQNLWGFGKERFWVFNIWKIQNLIKQIDSENVENPKPNFLKDWCRIFNLWKTQNLPILKLWETFQTLFTVYFA